MTVRECITPDPTAQGKAYQLPPNSGWTVLATLEFNHQTTSDYIANVVLEFTEGNTANTWVEYQIILDGVAHGWFTRLVPDRFRSTQLLRSVIADVPGGIHTLGIQARNLSSTNSVYYSRAWISPFLVEGSEETAWNVSVNAASVGTAWTTLLSTSIFTPWWTHMNYLAAFVTVTGGTPLGGLEYRILRGMTEVERFIDTVPDSLADGMHFAYIDKSPPGGTNSYHLQTRITSGSTATLGARSLHAQTMPRFTVFEAQTTSNITIPSDGAWHTVASATSTIGTASIGARGTDGSGYAHVTHTGPYQFAGELKFELPVPGVPNPFEVGWIEVHPVGHRRLMASLVDWEQIGLNSSNSYTLSLQAIAYCSQTGAQQTLARSRFQVVVTPDDTDYTHHSCATNPAECCANNYPSCLVYDCAFSSSMALVPIPPLDCF